MKKEPEDKQMLSDTEKKVTKVPKVKPVITGTKLLSSQPRRPKEFKPLDAEMKVEPTEEKDEASNILKATKVF